MSVTLNNVIVYDTFFILIFSRWSALAETFALK